MEQDTGTPAQSTGTPPQHGYRTTSSFQFEDRQLVLRGGTLDGLRWSGKVEVGKRVFCGTGEWTTDEVYLVTPQVEKTDDGQEANIAIPAFA